MDSFWPHCSKEEIRLEGDSLPRGLYAPHRWCIGETQKDGSPIQPGWTEPPLANDCARSGHVPKQFRSHGRSRRNGAMVHVKIRSTLRLRPLKASGAIDCVFEESKESPPLNSDRQAFPGNSPFHWPNI